MDFTPPPIEDGFTTEKLFNQGFSYTYDDVIFPPHYIDFPTDVDVVDLSTQLTRHLPLSIPVVASPMDTVSESAMASLGGIVIVHSNTSPSSQASFLRAAKSRRVPILSDLVFCSPYDVAEHEDDFVGSLFLLLTDTSKAKGKLLGYVAKSDWMNRIEKVMQSEKEHAVARIKS